MVAAPVPPPLPVVARPVAPLAVATAMPVPFAAAPQEDDLTGAKAIEVAALLGASVLGVKHCIAPKRGKVSARTWGLFAAGAACLVIAAVAFAISVLTASFILVFLDFTVHVLH